MKNRKTALYLSICILIITVIIQYFYYNNSNDIKKDVNINERKFETDESLTGTNYFNVIVPRRFEQISGEPANTFTILSDLEKKDEEKLVFDYEKTVTDIELYIEKDIEQFIVEGNIQIKGLAETTINQLSAYTASFKYERNRNGIIDDFDVTKYYVVNEKTIIEITAYEYSDIKLKSNSIEFQKIINSILINK